MGPNGREAARKFDEAIYIRSRKLYDENQ